MIQKEMQVGVMDIREMIMAIWELSDKLRLSKDRSQTLAAGEGSKKVNK